MTVILPKILVWAMAVNAGFTVEEAKTMTCIAELESGFNPAIDNRGMNKNGSVDWGLYQINDRFWFKSCGLTEKTALDPKENTRCARQVYKALGYKAWVAYNRSNKCKYSTQIPAL
jgi:lysozyme C